MIEFFKMDELVSLLLGYFLLCLFFLIFFELLEKIDDGIEYKNVNEVFYIKFEWGVDFY